MTLKDRDIWEYLLNQDPYIPQEFGIGIVGIGALFFAYGSVTSVAIRGLIALIGMAGSFVLWMHMFGARKEFEQTRKVLEKSNKDFFQKFDEARSWRYKGIYWFIYYPVTQLMAYFMGLISIAWSIIILKSLGVPLQVLTYLVIVIMILFFANAIYQRASKIREATEKSKKR
jgi:hypothetical protein